MSGIHVDFMPLIIPLDPAVQAFFSPLLLFIYQLCTSLKFVNKDIIGDSVESLTKIKKNNIHCSSFTHQASLFIEENSKVCHRIIDVFKLGETLKIIKPKQW